MPGSDTQPAVQPQEPAAASGMDAGRSEPSTSTSTIMSVAGSGGATVVASGAAGAGQLATVPAMGAAGSGGSSSAPVAGGADPESCEPVPDGMQLAFPGAEGFGRFARGGRGGEVCHVTTLADQGAGSLRDCVSAGDRTVVFDVSGWITLSSNLGITVDRITLAGQTAPGGGIGVRGQKLSIGGSDIVIRFMRVRRGIVKTGDRNDAMSVSSKSS
ncbi:MAG TPA: hypothetical protein VMF89_24725, partial [Polyangiales bacterium]|nr:hypothetical protein [Polyangiales bacterium]